MHVWQRDEASAIFWPAFENRQIAQRKIAVTIVETMNDFLTCAFFGMLGTRVQEMNALFQQAPTFANVGWWFCFQDQLNFLSQIIDTLALQRQSHPTLRSHRVNRDWKFRRFSIDKRLLKKQGLTTAGRFHFAVSPFADRQIGIDLCPDALQLASAIQRIDELRERAVGHLNVVRLCRANSKKILTSRGVACTAERQPRVRSRT